MQEHFINYVSGLLKKLSFVFCILLFHTPAWGTDAALDLLTEARSLLIENPQKARELILTELTGAETLADGQLLARAHLLVAATYVEEKSEAEKAKHHLHFAQRQIASSPNSTLEAEALLIEGRIAAYFDNDVPTAIKRFDRALQLLANNSGASPRLLKHALHEAIGRAYNDQAQFSLGSQHMLAALALTQKTDDPLLKAWTRVYLAQSYKGLLQSQQAIKYLLSALSIAEKAKDDSLSAYIFGRLGLVYKQLSNYSRAQDYVERSAEIYQSLNDDSNLAHSLNFLGTIYEQQGQYDTALLHYLNALELTRNHPTATKLGLLYHNIGQIYLHQDDYVNAQRYLERSLQELTTASRDHYLGASHLLMAKLKHKQNSVSEALQHAHQSLKLSSESEYLFTPAEAHLLLATLYADKELFADAYHHQRKASDYQRPDKALLPPAQVSDERYQQQQLQRTLQSLRNQLEDTSIEHEQQSSWLIISLAITAICVLLLILILRLYLSNKRQTVELKKQQFLHPTTGLLGTQHLHDFLKQKITDAQKQHEIFYSESDAQGKDHKSFYLLIELPVLKQVYVQKGFKAGRLFDAKFGELIQANITSELKFFHPREYVLCACLTGTNYLTSAQAVKKVQAILDDIFEALALSERARLYSIGVISMPFLSKASRAIDSNNLPELLVLALNGANQLRVINGESAWVTLHAIDATPGTLFNNDARTGCLLGLRKGLVKVQASHDKQLIEWPND
ncbi:tetratricopeptide repeat protein [Corallincola luteus]|uniref:Tetratricopeptide repeat protein n=1 Tax=Corallincola luteus TaxID=1775177 RepID=A0ABY2AN00_9GAMM|nr:tetratricopeptide repeat protein [Corallincola luteus]TCI02994.1 tetratricopeptide repeat protein [Corallincola luteus]